MLLLLLLLKRAPACLRACIRSVMFYVFHSAHTKIDFFPPIQCRSKNITASYIFFASYAYFILCSSFSSSISNITPVRVYVHMACIVCLSIFPSRRMCMRINACVYVFISSICTNWEAAYDAHRHLCVCVRSFVHLELVLMLLLFFFLFSFILFPSACMHVCICEYSFYFSLAFVFLLFV